MMKLWILRPIEGQEATYWEPWYDKCFGAVVRARSEDEARSLLNPGDEGARAWLDKTASSCVELLPEGEVGLVIEDLRRA